ncbi:sarcosine oxidase subunit delta [Pelagibius sp. CAU 1746]|uniref:sarcosine oxidase subunit delta n=1 Tax=Pelagibius sp. CAU 1746 TaxID=3140370 RepID=UPI00325A6ED2
MMVIACPFCGPRPEIEFSYGGDASLSRPPEDGKQEAYLDYLYLRDNPRGWHEELWVHRHGCGAWISLRRHTVTHEIGTCRYAGDARRPGGGEEQGR